MRSDARAFFGYRFLRDLDQYLLALAQEVRDRGLMSLTTRLSAMPALFAPTLIAAWTRFRWCLRSNDLFLWFYKLNLLDVVILPVGVTTILRLCCLRPLRTVLSCAASPSSSATSRELTARLTVNQTCFRIRISAARVSTFWLTFFTRCALFGRLLARCFFLRCTGLRRSFWWAFLSWSFACSFTGLLFGNYRFCSFFFIVADALEADRSWCVVEIVNEARHMRLTWPPLFANRLTFILVIRDSLERLAAESCRKKRTDFSVTEFIFHVEFNRMNLIEETLLQPCVFEHLAIGSGLFFVHDPFNRRIGRDKRCVGNFEARRGRLRLRCGLVRFFPTPTTAASATATASGLGRLRNVFGSRDFLFL